MIKKVFYIGAVVFLVFTVSISSHSFYSLNSSYPAVSSDMDPLVDLAIHVDIERVRKIIINDEPSFTIKISANEQRWEGEILFRGYDIMELCTAHFDIPDDNEMIPVSIEVWAGETSGDISPSGDSLNVVYDVKRGTWNGDDFLNDDSGFGHSSGSEDGDIDDSDFEIWFNIGFNDYDNDGLTYWEEVNIYGTDPEISDLGEDYDNDSIPIEWEDYWGYDPFSTDRHTDLDPDRDGIQNIEEYEMRDWFADPFRQDIFIENDYMAPRGNIRPIMPEKSIQMQYSAFTKHNIMLLIDDGLMGGSEEIPYKTLNEWDDFHEIYNNYFLHNDEKNPRRGIFHYAIIIHSFNGFGRGVAGFNFRGDAFTVASAYIQKWRPWEEGMIVGHGGSYMHELGHQLGLGHLQVFPWQLRYWLSGSYKSCMNYRYNFKIVDYSDGTNGFMDRDEWSALNLQEFERD